MTLLALVAIPTLAVVICVISRHRHTFERGVEEGRRRCLIDERFDQRNHRHPDQPYERWER